MIDRIAVSRDELDNRADLIRARLSDLPPDFPTALGMLGLAILQLRELGALDSNIREAVEYWLAQRSTSSDTDTGTGHSSGLWKPDPAHMRHAIEDWIKGKGKGKPR